MGRLFWTIWVGPECNLGVPVRGRQRGSDTDKLEGEGGVTVWGSRGHPRILRRARRRSLSWNLWKESALTTPWH